MTTQPTSDSSPADLKLKLESQELQITWRDGQVVSYPLAYLRGQCPCASCRTEREKKTLLPILSIDASQPIRVVDAKLMGSYAIQLVWSDGHDTGIFDYTYLRSLDPPSST